MRELKMVDEQAEDAEDASLQDTVRTLIEKAGGVSAAARLISKGRNTVDQWYRGNSKMPLAAAVDLARAIGTGLDELAGLAGRVMRQSQVMSTDPVTPDGFVPVPMFDVQASAGNGLVPLDQQPREDVLSLRGDWLRSIGLVPGRAEAMFVTGDSMEPTIKDGDMILVDRAIDRIVDGGIYVLVVNGEVRVKRVFVRTNGSLLLQSDNEVWADEVVSADERTQLAIEGRVRWFGRLI